MFITSLSRISDYHHRGSDVLGGMLIGLSVALFITCIAGKVIWKFERKMPYYEFDLKPKRQSDDFSDTFEL